MVRKWSTVPISLSYITPHRLQADLLPRALAVTRKLYTPRPTPGVEIRVLEAGPCAGARYSDAKVANRDIRVWHGATEKGP
jgi:hypothetical protein